MPYHLITQSAQEVMRPENSPARNMSEYLEQTSQNGLVSTISVYSQRGETAEQLRLYYMNDVALNLWRKMGHSPEVRETTVPSRAQSRVVLRGAFQRVILDPPRYFWGTSDLSGAPTSVPLAVSASPSSSGWTFKAVS